MTDWVIWFAESEDEAALVALEAASFAGRSWGENNVRESFHVPGVAILMAGANRQQPMGFLIWRDLGGEAEILSLGVAPDTQRNGVGKALLSGLIDQVRQANADRLFLEVDEGNAAACALYQQAGFTQSGLRKSYYRDGANAVMMQLVL